MDDHSVANHESEKDLAIPPSQRYRSFEAFLLPQVKYPMDWYHNAGYLAHDVEMSTAICQSYRLKLVVSSCCSWALFMAESTLPCGLMTFQAGRNVFCGGYQDWRSNHCRL